jgi:integrase
MLTDADCRNATCPPDAKRQRLTDGAGLYLEVSPTGSKRWFWKFYPDGKESRLALGSYPAVTLKAARKARDDAKRLRETGANPVQHRKAAKLTQQARSTHTFEAAARALHAAKAPGWSASHARQWLRCCEKDLFPHLGALPLADITAPVLLAVLRRVERRGALQLVRDLREYAGQVFRFGIQEGHCSHNPAPDLVEALKAHTKRHMAAVLEPHKVGELMRALDGYHGQPTTRAALLLSALLFQRPGNMRAMEWAEIDAEGALWTIPAAKMKRELKDKLNGRPHLVPLPPQALALLEELRPLTGHSRYVFPSLLTAERCMSDGTVNTALRRLGYSNTEATAHGFRAMARTLLVEQMSGVSADVIEAQLAHGKSGPLGAAYDRAEFLAQRRELMARWADYLDSLKAGAKVLPFKAA